VTGLQITVKVSRRFCEHGPPPCWIGYIWQMQTRGFVGQVGGLAVALGIGSAVALGWGCGAAAADASDASSSTTKTSTERAGGATEDRKAADRGSERRHDRPSSARNDDRDADTQQRRDTATERDSPESDPERPDRISSYAPRTMLRAADTRSETAAASAKPRPVPPDDATAAGVLAYAGRELERARRAPEKTQAATPVGLAPGIVIPPALTDHHAVTGPPSVLDHITVLGLQVLRSVSNVIGIDLVMKSGEAILSPKPPWFTTLGLDVARSEHEGEDVWTITPPKPTGEVVVAAHGSGFIYPPNIIHWLDYTQMARQTGATVVVPRYPLIPDGGTAANSVPPMADFIAGQVEMHGADQVSVYGDSAGGTLAMLAVQKIVRDCNGDSTCLATRVPSRMVLLSPGLSGPEIYTDPNVALVRDPVSPIPDPDDFDEWSAGDPQLSNPMLGRTMGLPPTTVYIGTREIGAPGVLAYGDRLLTANPDADFHVVIGMGQIHDWAQGGGLPLNSQSALYRDDVYRQLGIVNPI
jgi:acetyl esterase/lipase